MTNEGGEAGGFTYNNQPETGSDSGSDSGSKVVTAAAAANNVVGNNVGNNDVTWLSMADNDGVTAADNNMGDDNGWVNGGQRCGRWRRVTTWAKSITV